ncbi:MAG: transposase [Pyrinomonadaceae bacterium]
MQAMLISAVPSDLRKVFDLPANAIMLWGYAPAPFSDFKRHSSPIHLSSGERSATSLSVGQYQNNHLPSLERSARVRRVLIFANVIMLDHLHLLTNQPKTSAEVLRYLKGITARRTIDHLRQNNFQSSLAKLQHESWKREHRYSLWQQEKNVFSIYSESMFMQKVNYIHLNPVRAGLVERPIDYRWSSARIWHGQEAEDEPLRMDIDRIRWRAKGHSPRHL